MAELIETVKNILFSCCTSSPATKGHDHHVEHDYDDVEDRHAENQHLDNVRRNDGLENLRSPRNVSPAAQSTGRNVSTAPHSTEKHHPRVVEPVHEPIYSTPDSGRSHGLTIRNADGLYHPTTRSHKSAKLLEQGSSLEIVDDGESMGSPALKYYNKFGDDGNEVAQNANFPQEDEKNAWSEEEKLSAFSRNNSEAVLPYQNEKAASPHSEKAHSEKADSPRSEQAAAPAAHDGEKALSPRSEHAAQRESEQAAMRKIMEGGDDEEQEKPRVSLASSNNSFDFE